jgi:TolB protein
MNADGSGKVQITDNPAADFAPTLSPDGSQVAFVSDRAGGFDIFVTSADGSGEETNLTGPNEFAEFAPDWSPDGSRILYIADQEGLPNVWLMQTDGSGKSNITRNPDERQNNPAWSPDSSRIAYEFDYFVDDQDISVINADGTGRFGLVATSPSENNPTWSPDGARIAYEKEGDIYTVKLDGSERTNLTNSPDALDKDPDWIR